MQSPAQPSRTAFAALLTLVLALAACGQSPSAAPSGAPSNAASAPASSAPSAQASPNRVTGWRADLAKLVPGMDAIHPNLTHSTSRADLDAAVNALSARVETATDDELMVGVLGIVAMVSAAGCDAHTGAFIWGLGSYPVDSLPLRLWLFGDEVVVVDALAPYKDLIGARIDTIGGHPIADVLAAIDPIVPRDNAETVRLLTPRFLLIPQVLRGLGLLGADGPVPLGLTAVDGTPSTTNVEPVPMSEYNGWAGPYGLHLPADPDVLYLSRIDDALWWERQTDGTLFVQSNRTDAIAATQQKALAGALADAGSTQVVLDLRHNFGGELSAVETLVALFDDPSIDLSGRLFVATGRNTFSGGSLAVARLDARTDATIIGEPMGGCPTIWSDPTELRLQWSGIVVNVADDVAVGVDPDDARLTIEPDVPVALTREDWAAGIDPVLSLIVTSAP